MNIYPRSHLIEDLKQSIQITDIVTRKRKAHAMADKESQIQKRKEVRKEFGLTLEDFAV